jgi:hypothetical protein
MFWTVVAASSRRVKTFTTWTEVTLTECLRCLDRNTELLHCIRLKTE